MNCFHHPENPIAFICKAQHVCSGQRKLCADCLYEHEVELKHAIPIKKFREFIIQKIEQSNFEKNSTIKEKRLSFKATISKNQELLKKMFEDLLESITKAFDLIE